MTIIIKTNNIPRQTINGYELSQEERKEFDYYTDEELDQATFVRYKSWLLDMAEFMRIDDPEHMPGWDGAHGLGYWSGILIKVGKGDYQDEVVMGTYQQVSEYTKEQSA